MKPGRLAWRDIENKAKTAFSVWTNGADFRWARRAWKALEQGGVTSYSNEVERELVLCRFWVLNRIYRDYSEMAWDECGADDCDYTGELDMGILAELCSKYATDAEGSTRNEVEVLVEVVESQCALVVATLTDGFGGIEELHKSLWRSGVAATASDGSINPDPFNISDPGCVHGLQWLMEGCYRINC